MNACLQGDAWGCLAEITKYPQIQLACFVAFAVLVLLLWANYSIADKTFKVFMMSISIFFVLVGGLFWAHDQVKIQWNTENTSSRNLDAAPSVGMSGGSQSASTPHAVVSSAPAGAAACPEALRRFPDKPFSFVDACYAEAGCGAVGQICSRLGMDAGQGWSCVTARTPLLSSADRLVIADIAVTRGCRAEAFAWLAGSPRVPALRDKAVNLTKAYCDDPLAPRDEPGLERLAAELGVAIPCLN